MRLAILHAGGKEAILREPDLQPMLTGRITELRPVRTEDWGGMFAAGCDPLIWEVHPAPDRYKEPEFRKYFDDALDSKAALTIRDRATGTIIGSSRYNDYDPERSEIEIGWTFLARNYWGGAYNREIKDLMLRHIFQYVDTVLFWVGKDNVRSRSAMEKIGGVLRNGDFSRDGLPYVIYEIEKQNWSG